MKEAVMEKEKSKAEVNALTPVPTDERKGWIAMAFVQAGICVCVPSFLEGAILAEAMPVWPAIISGTLGYVIVVVVMSILGMMGCDLGVPSCTLTRATFGDKGGRYIVSVLFAINLIGWFGIQNGLCGEAFTNFMSEYVGISIPLVASNVLWGLIMLLTAVYGVSALEKLDYVSIPLLMIIMTMGTVMAIKVNGLTGMGSEVTQTMSFLGGVGLSFNFYAVGTITAADITRFQRTRKDTIKSVVWGVFPMGVITLVLGVLLTKIAGNYDISMVLIDVGLPVAGVVALILATWTTNSTNAYSSGLDIVMIFKIPDNRRREVTVVAGLIGIVLGAFGILDHVEGFLSFLSFLVCPIGGVMMADYWIVGKGKAENWHPVEGFNKIGVLSWALAAVIAYLCKIEYLGIVVGLVIYLILERFVPSLSRGAEKKVEA
ncbi:cytosine permease [Aminipila luticellarii]|uniref:Cytosine permease n=2 Tax=Aminipila luticellarii TaxID=2507160 RepID=A0A410PTE8_9FIRM|nr:cytosine permease [Aminipila luticellarii]